MATAERPDNGVMAINPFLPRHLCQICATRIPPKIIMARSVSISIEDTGTRHRENAGQHRPGKGREQAGDNNDFHGDSHIQAKQATHPRR